MKNCSRNIGFLVAVALLLQLAPAQIKNFKFEIETLGGQKLTQDDFKDNVVLVDFWGTWCPPCRKAIPDLAALYKKYKHHGLEIIGLNYREKGGKRAVREFAIDNDITYHLAMGTNDIKKQVLGFGGYPTMLFFKKGMKYSHLEVGYADGSADKIESWVRKALGLDEAGDDEPDEEASEEEEAEEKDVVEEGRIYLPGNHDKGFSFEVEDVNGATISFAGFKGKKVVLAMTSTWDEQAVQTAKILNAIHNDYGETGVAVIAACIETGSADKRLEKLRKFAADHKLGCTVFATDIKFLRKLHRPGGIPTFLVFDGAGILKLRLENDRPKDKLLKAMRDCLDGKAPEKAEKVTPKKAAPDVEPAASKPASKPTSRPSK